MFWSPFDGYKWKTVAKVFSVVLGLDLLSKYAAHLAVGSRPFWDALELMPGTLFLHEIHNPVGPMGFLSNLSKDSRVTFFTVATVLATLFLAGLISRIRLSEHQRILPIALILGGIWGNGLDRLVRGSVTDWLVINWAGKTPEQFGINVADIAIGLGLILAVFAFLAPGKPHPLPIYRQITKSTEPPRAHRCARSQSIHSTSAYNG